MAVSIRRHAFTSLISLTALVALAACSSDDSNQGTGGSGPGGSGGSGGSVGGAGGSGGSGGSGATPSGGAPAVGAVDWTMLGYNAQSTYNNTAETKISRGSVGSLTEAFTVNLDGPINGAPLQVDGVLYVGSQVNRNVAVDLETGEILWDNQDFLSSASYAYKDGVLYVHDFGGILRALDAADGTEIWNAPTTDQGSIGFSSPILANGKIYIGGSNAQELLNQLPTFRGFVYAANQSDGAMAWNTFTVGETETGASMWSSISIDEGGLVYASTGNNYTEPATDTSDAIIAMNDADGAIVWKNQRYEGDIWSIYNIALGNPDYDFGTNPILFEAEVGGSPTELVSSGQKSGDMHVLRRDDGSEVCMRNLSPGSANGASGIFNNGAWDGTHLLYAANDAAAGTTLFAINPADCSIAWEVPLPGPVLAPVTVANGVGFVGADSTLVAFDTDTGDELFTYDAPSTIASTPTVSDGRVAFGTGINWSVGSPGTMLVVLSL